jgi:hypothetical protein
MKRTSAPGPPLQARPALLRVPRPVIPGDSLDGAIAATVAYLDIFACAPRAAEIHRFLVGWRASRSEVEQALSESRRLGEAIAGHDGFWHLRGKPHLVPRRVRFLEHSRQVWPRARHMAELVARSGLSSCGMVTGSLAADNADEHADVDFLFVYPSARAWTSYAVVRGLAKLPGLGVGGMCPNYCLPDDRLEIRPQNLFTAWEVAKAVPLFGFDTYRRFVLANRWVAELLPNAMPMLDQPGPETEAPGDPLPLRVASRLPPLSWLEQRERRRKFRRDERDVGVDMQDRLRRGSVDRHSPTRSFQALCEFRYRMELLGLTAHPVYPRLATWTSLLDDEMRRWGHGGLLPIALPSSTG